MQPMFSYRHAFHAGNHADVLKHLTLVACLQYLAQKDVGLLVADTHAGTGIYRLDQELARTSGESERGIVRLAAAARQKGQPVPAAVQAYLNVVQSYNLGHDSLRHYPGSPWICQTLLRAQDQLKLFEVHPTDARLLERNVADLGRGKQIELRRSDGFTGLRALLPPPTRRALVLIDPSYELKTDYAAVLDCLEDALERFPTGCYAVWYPVIARPESHSLARKLKTLCARVQRPWALAQLDVGQTVASGRSAEVARGQARTPLHASAVHLINPPYAMAEQWRNALPWVCAALKEGPGAQWVVEQGP
ncbi:protein involved in catabolism of external DNA [Serpentinimonas raichei]|uniref:Ribosomal RNA large subunit methyltransferase J n=2 Tax=Serpentinimonas raichei TaxID=1458425 RepID=A0A060NJR4_9BURK|nr:protein involved in catabolism of external DNA [Serpentinimonas raichei]